MDETPVKTNMAKTTTWAPRGQRLVNYPPFGHWRTQTVIGALRHDRLDAPWVKPTDLLALIAQIDIQLHHFLASKAPKPVMLFAHMSGSRGDR